MSDAIAEIDRLQAEIERAFRAGFKAATTAPEGMFGPTADQAWAIYQALPTKDCEHSAIVYLDRGIGLQCMDCGEYLSEKNHES